MVGEEKASLGCLSLVRLPINPLGGCLELTGCCLSELHSIQGLLSLLSDLLLLGQVLDNDDLDGLLLLGRGHTMCFCVVPPVLWS